MAWIGKSTKNQKIMNKKKEVVMVLDISSGTFILGFFRIKKVL